MAHLMSCFSRLYTNLQLRGFTCSIDDLSLDDKSERSRKEALLQQTNDVSAATEDLLGMDDSMRAGL